VKTNRPLAAEDILFPAKLPPHHSLDDPYWAETYEWWEREWTDWETIAPRGGFIEDFLLATKGTETASSFAIWTALAVVASVLDRDAYLNLYPVSWYPNLYLIFAAPPGRLKKSTVLNHGASLLTNYEKHIPDENLRHKKRLHVHTNRVTPEGLQDLLAPIPPMPSKRKDIPDVYVDKGSTLALFISELSTFLGRQSYNLGMVSKLTDLYESKARDADYTKKDGSQELRNVYVNFCAATTPADMNDVLPQEAFGGGLMSRTIVIYEDIPVRKHPLPIQMSAGPSHDDLREGLAWIAANTFGPYTMSKEALGYYYQWYDSFKDDLSREDNQRVLSHSRMDVLMIKIALLIRAQRYEMGREIGVSDLRKAHQLLVKTYTKNETATKNVGATEHGKHLHHVVDRIKDRKQIDRRSLLQSVSKYVSSEELSMFLSQLYEMGTIKIYLDDHPQTIVTRSSKELYVYVAGNDHD